MCNKSAVLTQQVLVLLLLMITCIDREIEAKTKAKLTGEIDINDMYSKVKQAEAASDEPEEEFDLSEEPAKAA
jgi:hypothetical protein